jgi:hypothetical protein
MSTFITPPPGMVECDNCDGFGYSGIDGDGRGYVCYRCGMTGWIPAELKAQEDAEAERLEAERKAEAERMAALVKAEEAAWEAEHAAWVRSLDREPPPVARDDGDDDIPF